MSYGKEKNHCVLQLILHRGPLCVIVFRGSYVSFVMPGVLGILIHYFIFTI